jgi:hypothetical protein
MRLRFIFLVLLFFLSFIYYPLQAQTQEQLIKPPKSRFIKEIGFSVGLGSNELNLKELNEYLEGHQIGKIDNELASRTLSLYLASTNGFKATMDINAGTSFENTMFKPNAFLYLTTYSLGATFYKSLLHTNRFEILLLGGFRFTNIDFEYNGNTNAGSSFDSLVSNPSGNASMFHLTSDANQDLNMGGRFQYRLGKKENIKSREYRIGFDSGYIYNFKNSNWGQVGSSLPTPAMPKIKSDNFYFHLTFSGYFKI